MSNALRANSRLHRKLGPDGVRFLEHAAGGISRLLPHVAVVGWQEGAWEEAQATFASARRREVRVVLSYRTEGLARSLTATVTRMHGKHHVGMKEKTIDVEEKRLCERLARLTTETLNSSTANPRALEALRSVFDENIVVDHLQETLPAGVDLRGTLRELHQLAEETYENKQLTFGCLISRERREGPAPDASITRFPVDYFGSKAAAKRYKALSDGVRTAYSIGAEGELVSLMELAQKAVTGRHWFPGWIEPLAYETIKRGALGLALTRQGDILVLENGSLRFSYRFGRWRFWSHHHLVEVLKALARTRRVPVSEVRRVTDAVYRTALDVSFRRTGALFVILGSVRRLPDLVRPSDQIGHRKRDGLHRALDKAVANRAVYTLPRSVISDLAGIDGAIVLDAKGRILAYGAVLEPKKQPKTKDSEGARTKAALAASNLGLAVKVSSDGDITAFQDEEKVFEV